MKANKIITLFIVLSLAACSHYSQKNAARSIAQSDTQESILVRESLAQLHPCESEYEKSNQNATYIYFENDIFFVLSENEITLSRLEACDVEKIKLSPYDQILRMLTHEDSGLWIHTLHGHVIRFDGHELRKINLDFPVSSFEFDGEHIKLYHSDKQGRYCDFDTLNFTMGQRPTACHYIEAELLWKDL
jgi:hypothetical protein